MKDRKGLTATVDVMIFIVILGIAASALYSVSDDSEPPDASCELIDELFSVKVRISDMIGTESEFVASLPDIMAASLTTDTRTAAEYTEAILDEATGRPGSYRLDLEYKGIRASIGDGDGTPVSVCVRDFSITFGGTLWAELILY